MGSSYSNLISVSAGRFLPYEVLKAEGKTVYYGNYDKVYEAPVSSINTDSKEIAGQLEAVFVQFNTNRPEDFSGHSLSISDIVTIEDKAYYVDSFGFKPLENFLPKQEKQLEAAQDKPDMSAPTLEQDKVKPSKKMKL